MRLSSQCWIGPGKHSAGYSHAKVGGRKGKVVYMHRAAFEVLVGPIPAGLDLDHLCRNRACYNPSHLEPVTRSENLRRSSLVGRGQSANALKTHCPAGHPYVEANTYTSPSGARRCRSCAKESDRRRRG